MLKNRASLSADGATTVWVDPRGLQKSDRAGGGGAAAGYGTARRLAAALAGLTTLLVLLRVLPDAILAVECAPLVPTAGTNVTCSIRSRSGGADVRIVQQGTAGLITLLSDAAEGGGEYRVSFATASAGPAGVRVVGPLIWRSVWVDVVALAASTTDVSCAPARAVQGEEVRCAVVPRDVFGNLADVVTPPEAPAHYFSVSRIGAARDVTVHDADVSFVVGAGTGDARAGIAVTLDGRRSEATIEVVSS